MSKTKCFPSQRSNGILYYRVKWKQPGSGSTWEYASSIPQMLIREFHASRTMSGKKRRRPLKGKHKFFEKTENQTGNLGNKGENQDRVQNGKSHPRVPNENQEGNNIEINRVSSAPAAEIRHENEQNNGNNSTSTAWHIGMPEIL